MSQYLLLKLTKRQVNAFRTLISLVLFALLYAGITIASDVCDVTPEEN